MKKHPFQRILLIVMVTIASFLPLSGSQAQEGPAKVVLPILMRHFITGNGIASGVVIDSTTRKPIVGDSICYQGNCTTSDGSGGYQLGGLPAGMRSLSATNAGYNGTNESGWIVTDKSTPVNFALSKRLSGEEGEQVVTRIVLTWDETPAWSDRATNDLDAHLWLDVPNPPTHIGYNQNNLEGECTIFPNSCLRIDYREGFGPETVDIRVLENATYYYGVVNYNQDAAFPEVPPIVRTEAKVVIYDEAGISQVFSIPAIGEGDFWFVFTMDGFGRIHPVNCITRMPEEGQIPACP